MHARLSVLTANADGSWLLGGTGLSRIAKAQAVRALSVGWLHAT